MKKEQANFKVASKQVLLATMLVSGFLAGLPESAFAHVNEVNVVQQGKVVKGQVVDSNGEPIIGATIKEKGTKNGVVTDLDGNYTLNVSSASSIVSVSYIGFKTIELGASSRALNKIVMQEANTTLDGVVVVAYGSVVKRKITNAVTSVDMSQIGDLGGYSNMSSALQGRTPGAIISNSSGMPGSTPSISIRGNGTPLYVIDGIVQDEATFNRLNSQDIESISIMKDAASAAVYGAQAGNGIVVVKTKSGTVGKVRINYTLDHQFTKPTNGKTNISSYDLATTRNYLDDVYGFNRTYSQEALDAYLSGSDPDNYPNVNWRKEIMRDVAQSDRHSLTVDGGSEDTQFRMSLGYYDQGSLIKPVAGKEVISYKTANIGASVTHYFRTIGLKVGLDIKNSFLWKNGKSEGEIMRRIKNYPTEKIYNSDGTYFANQTETSYLYLHPDNGYVKQSEPVMNNRLNLEWDVLGVKGLKALFVGNYKTATYSQKSWNNAYVLSYLPDGSIPAATTKPALSMEKKTSWAYELNVGLQYKNTFADAHSLSASVFYNQMESYTESLTGSRKDYLTSAVDQIFAGPTINMSNGGSTSESGRLGYVGVLNYDYKGRYLVGASLRIDGSDNYSDGNRYGYFPSVSAGYVVSDEPLFRPFFDKLKVNMLKLRAAWGKTGIEGSRFAYFSNWSIGTASFDINGEQAPMVNTPGLISPDLTWYSTASTNLGIDLTMLNNRLSATFDYFYQDTKNYLRSPKDIYSTTLGTSLPQVMSDDVFRRAGGEMTLRWRDSYGDFKYEAGMNLSYYDEIWRRINEDDATRSNPLISAAGKTLADGSRTWIADGLYQNMEDLLNSPHALWTSNVKTGDIKYRDMNGDGRIDTDGTYSDDKVYNGKPTKPILQYGFDFLLSYKGFTLSGLIQGSGSNYKLIGTEGMAIGFSRIRFNSDLDFWTPQNTSARYPIPDTGSGLANNGQSSTFWEVDCKYVRLKNLQLSYDFKYRLLKNVAWLSNLTVSLVGQNLATWSKAKDYYLDPEQGNVDNFGYPITKTYSLVFNIGF